MSGCGNPLFRVDIYNQTVTSVIGPLGTLSVVISVWGWDYLHNLHHASQPRYPYIFYEDRDTKMDAEMYVKYVSVC